MNMKDIELKLLAGLPVPIDGLGQLRLPKLKEVISIGESIYNQYLSALLFSKKNLEQEIEEDIDNFSLLFLICLQDESFKDIFLKSLELLFESKSSLHQEGFFYLGELEDQKFLHKGNFDELQKVLKLANNIEEEEEEYNAGNDKAKKFIEMMKKKKAEAMKAKKEKVNLHSLISGIAWRCDGNFEEILNLTIYQLYNGYFRLMNIDNYEHINLGIYTGNVDTKKMKNDLSDLGWANVLHKK